VFSRLLPVRLQTELGPLPEGSDDNIPPPGVFNYYVLALSWVPAFCAAHPDLSTFECDPNNHLGLVVHGLWPQYNNGDWPSLCASTPPVKSDTVAQMISIMPSESVIQHEWANHGTCSGLSQQEYFATIKKLYSNLKIPDDFKDPRSKREISSSGIEEKFANANGAPQGAFRVSCLQNEFSAVEICLTRNLQYQSCPATLDSEECKTPQINVRPKGKRAH
jgi:ribonuclease T2